MFRRILLLQGCYSAFFLLELFLWNDIVVLASSTSSSPKSSVVDPLLLRAARGEDVERFPVWMMRQAGRHMLAYQNLVYQYPTFRERSETPEISRRISVQPLERCEFIFFFTFH
jgi:hypothetical protein